MLRFLFPLAKAKFSAERRWVLLDVGNFRFPRLVWKPSVHAHLANAIRAKWLAETRRSRDKNIQTLFTKRHPNSRGWQPLPFRCFNIYEIASASGWQAGRPGGSWCIQFFNLLREQQLMLLPWFIIYGACTRRHTDKPSRTSGSDWNGWSCPSSNREMAPRRACPSGVLACVEGKTFCYNSFYMVFGSISK